MTQNINIKKHCPSLQKSRGFVRTSTLSPSRSISLYLPFPPHSQLPKIPFTLILPPPESTPLIPLRSPQSQPRPKSRPDAWHLDHCRPPHDLHTLKLYSQVRTLFPNLVLQNINVSTLMDVLNDQYSGCILLANCLCNIPLDGLVAALGSRNCLYWISMYVLRCKG